MKNRFTSMITIYLLISLFSTSFAATINVNGTDGSIDATDGLCSISEAIQAANSNAAVNECTAGSGADVITIDNDITLTTRIDSTRGNTGTPAITSVIVIEGNEFALQRDDNLVCDLNFTSSVTEFRILLINSSGNLSLNNITIKNGCTDGSSGGGGIYNRGRLSLDNVTIDKNKSKKFGGGIENRNIINRIANSTFSFNSSDLRGGGIATFYSDTISIIENSTFTSNSAVSGGAIESFQSNIDSINNSTFYGNTAIDFGGAIYDSVNTSTINLTNSLFLNNTSLQTNNNDCSTRSANFTGSNNISDKAAAGCPGMLATTITSSTVGTLADNGGPTMTHALFVGSEALDMGGGDSTTTDQRGITAFGVRDIGAYELQPIELCPIDLQTDGFNTTVINPDELNQAIKCANLNGNTLSDTINLGADITLTQEYENDTTYGRTGTPAISSTIILEGMGMSIVRDSTLGCTLDEDDDVNEFRLMRITNIGNLELKNITLSYGCIDGIISAFRSKSGGAIYNDGSLSIDNSVISENSAKNSGAGIYSIGTITTIKNSVLSENLAGIQGSGIYNNNTITTIQNSTFSENSTTNGGGIYNAATISTITNSTFSGNSVVKGGGIFNDIFSTITTIQNSTFSGNSASNGGGIFNNLEVTITTIQNSTFSGNSASSVGGGISNKGTISSLRNSLFHNNTDDCVNNNTISNSSNNMSNNASGGCPGTTMLTDTTVGPLEDNGGPTMTHALLVGSQAIDAAVAGTTTDQRGFAADGTRDIGAFEAQIPTVVAPIGITTEATGATTIVALGTPTITDVDELGLTATANPLGPYAVGIHTITWTATDAHGHIGTALQTVNVQAVIGGTVNGLNGTVILQNMGGDNLSLTANGTFRFVTAVDNLSNYAVTVLTQPATQTCVVSNLNGQVNGASISDIVVDCSENTISLDNLSLDFGMVFTSENSTQTATLTNTGTGDVIISSNTLPTVPFSIIGGSCVAPITLTAGQTCDYIIEFNPTTDGSFTGSFDIFSNVASSPTTINLTGSSSIRIIPTLSFYGLLLLMMTVLLVTMQQRKY